MIDTAVPRPLILILGGEGTARAIEPAVSDLRVDLERFEDCSRAPESARPRRAAIVVVDAACAQSPARLAAWVEHELFDPAVPLLLVAPRPVEQDTYREWLGAGAWEVVRLPVDPALMALRLRNMLGPRLEGEAARPAIEPQGPYGWPSLVRATDEVLALGRRHGRPVACAAISVESGTDDTAARPLRVLRRLGIAAQAWVRKSDLVGMSEHDVLLVVLPDTRPSEAEILVPRLVAALDRSLRSGGIVARLRSGTHGASWDDDPSAVDFLLAAIRSIG